MHVCTIAVGECDSVLVILLADRFPCCDTVINVVSKDASKARHVLKYCWFSYGSTHLGCTLVNPLQSSPPPFFIGPFCLSFRERIGVENIYLYFSLHLWIILIKVSKKKMLFLCAAWFLVFFSVPQRSNIFKISEFNWLKR